MTPNMEQQIPPVVPQTATPVPQVNEHEVTKYLVSHLTASLTSLHGAYFAAQTDDARKFAARTIQRLDNMIADLKKKLPNSIWS